MSLRLPADFVRNIRVSFREKGDRFLEELPSLLAAAARRWELTLGEPFLLSYNYVCAAQKPDGTPVVLKIGVPNPELLSEINALRLYAGQGACRLLDADPEKGMLVLERLEPGTMLLELQDDDRETGIAADVLCQIQRPAPGPEGFLSLRLWFDELQNLRPRFVGTTGPFPEKTVGIVEGLLRELFAEDRPDVLLHGDFHHYNVLLSGRGWLVIDPKGVIGPAGYDVGPYLTNPLGELPPEADAIRRTCRRVAIFSERLGIERERLLQWAACHSLLSSYWDLQDDGSGGEGARAWAEIFLKIGV